MTENLMLIFWFLFVAVEGVYRGLKECDADW